MLLYTALTGVRRTSVHRLLTCILFINLLIPPTLSANSNIKVGVVMPVTPGESNTGVKGGRIWAEIAKTAAAFINNSSFIPGYNIELIVYDTLSTGAGTARAAIDAAITDHCVGVVGDILSSYSELAQYVLQNFGLPQISPTSTATLLSDKSQFPTFMRTIPADDVAGPKVAQVIRYFKWNQVGLVVGSDAYSQSLFKSFTTAAEQQNITISVTVSLEITNNNNPDYVLQVARLKQAYTQVNVLFSEQADAEALLNEAYKQGILGKDFVWIGADAIHTINLTNLPANSMNGNLIVSATSTVNTSLSIPYAQQMASKNISDAYGGFIYDALFAYANAFIKMMQETSDPEPWSNTTALLATLKGINFTGVSGPVSFDKNGDRIPYGFDLQTFQKGGEVAVTGAISNDGVVTLLSPIVWSDGTTNIPTDYLHIVRNSPPAKVKIVFDILTIMALIIVVTLTATFLFVVNKKDALNSKKGYIAVHLSNAVGGIFGYTAILLIVAGVSSVHCTAAVVLFDLSFLICGGILSLRTLRKFVIEYHDHAKASLISPDTIKKTLYGIWSVLIALNIAVLIGTMSYRHPETRLHLLEKNIYEYQCHFGHLAIVILPITIGLLYLFSLFTILIKIMVNSAVATKKNDIVNSVNNIITLFALGIAAITLLLINPTQTQIDITICIVILLANMSVPANLITWLLSPKRLVLIGLEPPPNRQPARARSGSLSSQSSNSHSTSQMPSQSTLSQPPSLSRQSMAGSTSNNKKTHRESFDAADLNQM